jgi:hypothetical protein
MFGRLLSCRSFLTMWSLASSIQLGLHSMLIPTRVPSILRIADLHLVHTLGYSSVDLCASTLGLLLESSSYQRISKSDCVLTNELESGSVISRFLRNSSASTRSSLLAGLFARSFTTRLGDAPLNLAFAYGTQAAAFGLGSDLKFRS